MGKMSLLDRVELYSSILGKISLNPYADLSHLGNLIALANEADYLIARRTFNALDNCLVSIEERDFDYFDAVGSLSLVGIVPDSLVLCFRLVELLQNEVFENYSLKHYISTASCELTSCLVKNPSFPVELLMKNDFDKKFENDRFLERLNSSIKAATVVSRRDDVIIYLRESLKEQIDTSAMSDDMILNIFGIGK